MIGPGATEHARDPVAAAHLPPPHACGKGMVAVKAAPDAEPERGGRESKHTEGDSGQSERYCLSGSNRLSNGSFGSCIPETPSPVSMSSVPPAPDLTSCTETRTQDLFGEPIAAEGDAPTTFVGGSCMDEAELARGLVGRAIRKLFPSFGRFNGVISSFDAKRGMFTIIYEDEDKEEMSMPNIARYLPKEESRMVKDWLASQTAAGSRETERQNKASQCPMQCPVTGLPINGKLLNKLRNSVQVTRGTLTNALRNRLGWPPEVCVCVCVRVCVHARTYVRVARMYAHLHAHLHLYIYICAHVCLCTCAHACARVRTHMHSLHDP